MFVLISLIPDGKVQQLKQVLLDFYYSTLFCSLYFSSTGSRMLRVCHDTSAALKTRCATRFSFHNLFVKLRDKQAIAVFIQ